MSWAESENSLFPPAPVISHTVALPSLLPEAQLAGRFEELSWRRALEATEGVSRTRALVVAQPRLDFGSMAPAAAPIAALRAEAADLGITAEEGLRLSLTGAAVLDTEELESVGPARCSPAC